MTAVARIQPDAISDEAIDHKVAAIRAHATQVEFFKSLQQKFDYRDMARHESFARGHSSKDWRPWSRAHRFVAVARTPDDARPRQMRLSAVGG